MDPASPFTKPVREAAARLCSEMQVLADYLAGKNGEGSVLDTVTRLWSRMGTDAPASPFVTPLGGARGWP